MEFMNAKKDAPSRIFEVRRRGGPRRSWINDVKGSLKHLNKLRRKG